MFYPQEQYSQSAKDKLIQEKQINHDSKSLELIAHVGEGAINCSVADEEYIYCSNGCYIDVIEKKDVSDPERISRLNLGSPVYNFTLRENLLYVAVDDKGLSILDISDPRAIRIVNEISLPKLRNIYLYDEQLYCLTIGEGFYIYDISKPTEPSLVVKSDEHRVVDDICRYHNYLYVSISGLKGVDLVIYALLDNKKLQKVSEFTSDYTGQWGCDIFEHNGYLYQALGVYKCNIYKIHDDGTVSLVGEYTVESNLYNIGLVENYLLVSHRMGFDIVDISTPSSPVKENFIETKWFPSHFFQYNNILQVATGENGLWFFDISNISSPKMISRYDKGFGVTDFEINNNLLYIAGGQRGIVVFDITNPTSPVEVSSFETEGRVLDIELFNNQAIISEGDSGVRVIDFTSLQNPIEKAHIRNFNPRRDDDFYTHSICQNDNLLFIPNIYGCHIYDLIDLDNPKHIIYFKSNMFDKSVIYKQDLLYTANYHGFAIYDAKDLLDIKLLGMLKWNNHVEQILIDDDFAYIGNAYGGLRIIDIRDKNNPVEVEHFDTEGTNYVRSLAKNDSILFFQDYYGILRVLDVSNNSESFLLETLKPFHIDKVKYHDGYLFLSRFNSGIRIYKYRYNTQLPAKGCGAGAAPAQ
jgi:hypothetical protein